MTSPYDDISLNEELLSTGSSQIEEKKVEVEVKTPKWDKKIVLILTATLIANCCYIIVAPFLPLNSEAKGVNQDVMGLIFAVYPIASIAMSLFLAKYNDLVSKGAAICMGLAVMGACFICFGLLDIV